MIAVRLERAAHPQPDQEDDEHGEHRHDGKQRRPRDSAPVFEDVEPLGQRRADQFDLGSTALDGTHPGAIALHGDEVDHHRHESRRVEQGLQQREPPDRHRACARVPAGSIATRIASTSLAALRRLVAGDVAASPIREIAQAERQHEQPAQVHEHPTDDRERVSAAARLVAPRVCLDAYIRVVFGVGALPHPEGPQFVALHLHDIVGRGAEHVVGRRVGDAVHAQFQHPRITHRVPQPTMMGRV